DRAAAAEIARPLGCARRGRRVSHREARGYGGERRASALHRDDVGLTATLPTKLIGELGRAEPAVDQQTVLRIEHLSREVGWVLVTAGVVGLIVPGMPGAPVLLVGVFVL